MRIIKQRLLEMVPEFSIFLDVDDLEDIANLPSYLERTRCVLVFCSQGYFQSKNCMIEIRSTVFKKKPIIPVLDPDRSRGGLPKEQIREQLIESDDKWGKWGFANDGLGEAKGAELFSTLFSYEPIEWNRIGHSQDVTMRLIAERLLPDCRDGQRRTYVPGEVASALRPAPKPLSQGRQYHVYCSPANIGAMQLMYELGEKHELKVEKMPSTGSNAGSSQQTLNVASYSSLLQQCEFMLVYLNEQTWSSTDGSITLGAEIGRALSARIPLILAHEVPGVGGQEARYSCEFSRFYKCTPPPLLGRGLYHGSTIIPLKGGPWRDASLALLANEIANRPEFTEAAAYEAEQRMLNRFRITALSRPQTPPALMCSPNLKIYPETRAMRALLLPCFLP